MSKKLSVIKKKEDKMKYVSEEVLKRGLEWTLKEHHPLIEWFLNHGCEELPQDPWQKIEVEGLPKGWQITKVIDIYPNDPGEAYAMCSIKAIKRPRRIVIEETDEKYLGCQTLYIDGTEIMIMTNKTWREVKENDLSLNKDEPKLSLSVGDVKRILSNTLYCEDIVNRMREFLKEN